LSFLLPLALSVALLVALPILAHALRRGARSEVELPTARFSPARLTSTKQRSYLEDRNLLLLRVLLILLLALLAASPLARCSGPALARRSGGSLAVALVVDDSASMQVRDKATTRFERAVSTALDLLATSREGDSFVLILAGAPARIAVPRTTHVEDVRQALNSLGPTERDTDLSGALALAESSLRTLPQPEKHIAVLSDLATTEPIRVAEAQISLTFPLPALAQDFENCAILSARQENAQVLVETECTSSLALEGRSLRVLRLNAQGEPGRELARVPFTEDGSGRVSLPPSVGEPEGKGTRWVAELTRGRNDALPSDDQLEVALGDDTRYVAVFADRATASVETSDKTVVELALEALELDEPIRPLGSLPEKLDELRDVSLLIVDNPAGFRPETQNVLEAFVSEGGALLTLLGPAVDLAPLSAGFWPITKSSPHYRALAKDQNQLAAPAAELSELARGYDTLRPRRRVTLEPAPQTRTLLSFADGTPLLFERPIGLGRAFTSTLPASVEQSDFALRPGFLALIDHALEASRGQSSGRVSLPGATWSVPEDVEVFRGKEQLESRSLSPGLKAVTPEWAGRYTLLSGTLERSRFVTRHPGEHVRQPENAESQTGSQSTPQTMEKTSISREVALALLVLSAGELWLRSRRSRLGRSPAIGR
jgi:hypothetical protein